MTLLSILAVPCLALAQAAPAEPSTVSGAGERVVLLHDGSIYRGELVELVVGDHVTLKLATGEVKRFEWSLVKATRDVAPPQPTTPVPAAALQEASAEGPPRAPAPDPEYAVAVEFRADYVGAQLYRVTPLAAARDPDAWTLVCTAPCSTEVDRRFQYAVWGSNVSPSSPFALPTGSSSLRIQADVTRRSTRIAGWIMLGTGAGVAAMGALWILIAEETKTQQDTIYDSGYSSTYSSSYSAPRDTSTTDFLRTAGIVLVVGGGVVAVAGLAMGLSNTGVDVKAPGRTSAGRLRLGPGLALGPRGLEF